MLGLAIDSADRTASAALWTQDVENRVDGPLTSEALLAFEALPPEAGKADQLITVIERMLGEHGLDYANLDVIAVNRGPGSFTGIRSAVTLGRGLALAAGLPALDVTSHQALAAVIDHDLDERHLLIALDARRGEVYAQAFAADGHPLSGIEAKVPAAVAADLDVGSWRLAGSGAALVFETLARAADVRLIETDPIDAVAVASAAAARLSAGDAPIEGFALRPLYARPPDAVPPTPLISTTAASEVRI